MREIKFRAWYKEENRMIDLYKITPLILNENIDGLFIPFDKKYILMQFTGLLDKNGKEIYGGDVVKFHEEEICEINWDITGCCYYCSNGYDYPSIHSKLDMSFAKYSEVIGNIYENPELLN